MKTRVFKKVLSVICVLAMLLSVCVVSLVGTASAAQDYTLNVNGTVTTQSFNEGDALPVPNVEGTTFEGWYDSTFTTKYMTAGAERTLYAKFAATVIDFECDNCIFDPNNNFASSGYAIVQDPTDTSNKCIKYTVFGGRNNFGIPSYGGSGVQYPVVAGQKYEISFRYNATSTGAVSFNTIAVMMYLCEISGVGTTGGNKANLEELKGLEVTNGEWRTASYTFTASAVTDTRKYLLFTTIFAPNKRGTILFDDIMIAPIVEKQYTLNNKGVVTTEQLTPGAALPAVRGASFEGWYDKTLTHKYTKVPATVTELYAKFNKIIDSFENDDYIYDPNGNFASNGWFSIDADPADAGNGALKANVPAGSRIDYAVRGAIDADAGYIITKGQEVYTVSFKYKASGITPNDENVQFYTSADAGIGGSGNKSSLDWNVKLENSDTWVQVNERFVLAADSDIDLNQYRNILFTVYSDTAATVYIDDFFIAPYTPASTDDFSMDFEGNGSESFKWSVADANNYTTSSGNGYVNRGELVTDGGNTFFRVKHFAKKGAYIYFTLNDGSKQFEMVNYGLYTLEFDYKVEHSETPSAIGLVCVKPTTASTGLEFHKITEFDSFEYRDDTDWVHVKYTFGADLHEFADCTSMGLYVYNSTNVPESNIDTGAATATSVVFDNITVTTHSATQEDGMIVFDSLGGTSCTSIVGTATAPVGTLPQPTKYGYVFQGWKYDVTDSDGNTVSYDLTSNTLMPDFITNAYAVWKLADGVIELNFRTNVDAYDAATPTIIAFPGQPIKDFPTVNPAAAGQKFVGWYYDTGFTKPVDVNCAPNESATVYAKWESEGTIVDFEKYPSSLFDKGGVGVGGPCTDRMSIETLSDGNHVLYYDFSRAANKANTFSYAGIILYDTYGNAVTAYRGFDYTVTFKYKVLEANASGGFGMALSGKGSTWDGRMEQTGAMQYGKASDQWLEGTITFTATMAADAASNKNYFSFGVSNDCKIYIDDIVVISEINDMNIYGSAVIFNTNGGKMINPISGDPGTKIDLPTPVRAGYKFLGWYSDKEFTTPVTDAVYGEEMITLYAKWQLGKYTEGFEDYPASVQALGIAGAYSFYTKTSPGFDASNVHSGDTSLFRNGATAGVKSFTTTRSNELAIQVGDTYTLSFYVKPTSVTDAAGTISMINMPTFTGINNPVSSEVITKVSDLKEGEWNLVTYTFTATSEFIGIQTTAGNDMYFDDISVTLKGYTGSANTGDSSVNPLFVIALVVICAGALIITGKKVFSK